MNTELATLKIADGLPASAWPRRRRRRVPRIAHGRDGAYGADLSDFGASSGWPIAPPRPRCSGD